MSEEVLVTGTDTTTPEDTAKLDGATAPEGSGEAKPQGDAAKNEDGSDKPAADKPAGVPEKYEFKVPEGMVLDEAKAASFTEIAKKAGLSQESAQSLMDLYAAEHMGVRDAAKAEMAKWVADTKAHKELGGDKLPETIALANKAVDLGPPELKAFLKGSGLGNHPLIVQWAHAIGKKVAEDGLHRQGDGPDAGPDAAKILFPTMK
jgi:hypothetical protein